MIQACQAYNPAAHSGRTEDAACGDPSKKPYVVLDRPHTLLLMSTIVGETSVRGAFTGAIARQFANADGKTTINDMVTNAVIDMKKDEDDGYDQAPESRNTLQKSLVLPPGIGSSDLPQSQGRLSKESLLRKLGVL